MTLSGEDGAGVLGAAGSLTAATDAGGAAVGLPPGDGAVLVPVPEAGFGESGDCDEAEPEACGCRSKADAGLLPVAHWNHCLELELVRPFSGDGSAGAGGEADGEGAGAEASGSSARHPIVSVTCLERGSWGQVRILGYGRLDLSTEPGSSAQTLRLWRPVHSTVEAAVADFFFGGASRLVDLDERDDGLLPAVVSAASRLGLATEEAAQVHFRTDRTVQRAAYRAETGSWAAAGRDERSQEESQRLEALEMAAAGDPAASTVSMGHRASTRDLIEASRTLRRRTAQLAGGARPFSGRAGGLPPLRPGRATSPAASGGASPRSPRPGGVGDSLGSVRMAGVPEVDDMRAEG